MYIVIRHEAEGIKDTMCFIQTDDQQTTKRMVCTPQDTTEWLHIPDDLLTTLINVKEGYIAFDIEPV